MKNIIRTALRRLCFIVVLMFLTGETLFAQVNVVTERLRNDLISQQTDDIKISSLLESLKNDGSWENINYADESRTNWIPQSHTSRLLDICQAYNKPGSSHYHKPEVKTAIIKIIEFYINRKPISNNWWYNAIGAPVNLGPALVLMKNTDGYGIEKSQLERYANSLLNYYEESAKKWPGATTGANKIWLLKSSINKACALDNESILRENFRLAFEEASVMPGKKEGIKVDNSFYQHNTQLYAGGYGMSFMSDLSWFAMLAAGTDYRMSPEQEKVVADVLLDGYRWFIHRSAFDFAAVGREISRPPAGSSLGLRTHISRFINMNIPRKEELSRFIEFINGEKPFENPGNRHFWKSDIMVQHGPDFYLSARIPSKRTIGSERMNSENLLYKWLPWGSTCIMTEGDEYRQLFGSWDWSRIPGVTSKLEKVQGLPEVGGAYIVSQSEFAGGVSDSTFGLAAYDYSWDGVSGRKAWFFTPEAMYCLGAGITATDDKPTITSVNQCFSSGPATLLDGKKRIVLDGESASKNDPGKGAQKRHSDLGKWTADAGNIASSSTIRWVHHDRVGYLFPAGGEITVSNREQTGSWHDISLSQPKDLVTKKVFSTWINHGTKPSSGEYEYVVVPMKSLDDFNRWVQKNPYRKITNNTDIQAIEDTKNKITAIAFYKQGELVLPGGLAIGVNSPCLLLVRQMKGNVVQIHVADPTALQESITLKINRKLSQPGAVYNGKISEVKLPLPQDDYAGSTKVFRFNFAAK